jgi:hypothetical protein
MGINTYQKMFDDSFEELSKLIGNSWSPENRQAYREESLNRDKKLSQFVAKTWLPEGAEMRKIILKGDSDEIKKLLKDNGIDVIEKLEIVLSKKITIKVNYDSFAGTHEEQKGIGTIYNLPYPPIPSEKNVSESVLQKWVSDSDDAHDFPEDPYIPLTWC